MLRIPFMSETQMYQSNATFFLLLLYVVMIVHFSPPSTLPYRNVRLNGLDKVECNMSHFLLSNIYYYVRSIFEVEGADEVAMEVNSFSKMAGFTGIRLGWTVTPKKLKWKDGSSVYSDYRRVMATCFNGASNIAIVRA